MGQDCGKNVKKSIKWGTRGGCEGETFLAKSANDKRHVREGLGTNSLYCSSYMTNSCDNFYLCALFTDEEHPLLDGQLMETG